ncbi:desaturase-related protein [Mycobacterium tuberculosis BT1]|nr:desaturase-related protein [Mycobacterium tuberculosis BT1]
MPGRFRGLNRVFNNAFDLNYVALSLVTADGHTLLHHPYTQSEVDIKKNVFTMMMRLPWLYRVPVHTIHKFGHMLSGMAIRIVDVFRITRKVGVEESYGSWRAALPHFLGSAGVRLLLVSELVVFAIAGDFWPWALQFVATLWVSTFLVVASHEFEDDTQGGAVNGEDWGIDQLEHACNRVFNNAFDLNYVALSLVTADGHTLLHHPYTQSEVDIKKNVFTMMMRLPWLYRVPVHTIHKFGHMLSGMAIRIVDVFRITRKVGVEESYGSWRAALPHFLGSAGVRLLLVSELVVFAIAGDFWPWALQFVATLWVSTFLVVASHEFEDDTQGGAVNGEDWGIDQLEHANDLTVIGNRYVDCFLSAGLSSHRVHHVLPFQRSGFANIVTEDVLREEAAKFGVEWLPAKGFITDRLPRLCRKYLLTPSRQAKERHWGFVREHCSPAALKASASYVVAGFVGIGSV